MSAFIGPALLRKLIAEKAGFTAADVGRVLDAHEELVLKLVKSGAKVRALGCGHFEIKKTKKSRRWSPMTQGYVVVPAKRKIVFRNARTK
jgi:nucleoid DNA-binding protein